MARIRTIKPEFFTSEDIVSLTPLARLLYIAAWCEADKEGRMLWKPKTLKMRYFPADLIDIHEVAAEILEAGLVCLYGDGMAYIPTFKTHQHLNPRESASKLPEPDACVTRAPRVADACPTRDDATVTHREEGKGREGDIARQDDAPPAAITLPSRRKKSTPLPTNFGISDRVRAWAAEKGYTRLEARLECFVSYAKRNGKAYVDWDEAFMGAIREDWAKLCSKPGEADGHWSTKGLML